MGTVPHDYDICTRALPEQVKGCFTDARVLETGIKHGTVTLIVRGQQIEITTFRLDGVYTDHRRPDGVTFTAELREDLARRDFTINAMALSPTGEVVDCFGGRDDLRDGVIRCVGTPQERFEEDALRLLRALRFASRFGFAIEEETARAMLEKAPLLAYVAVERVLNELCGMDFARVPGRFLPVLQVAIPELNALAVPEGLPAEPAVRLAALLRGLPAGDILMRLKASRALTERVAFLVSEMDTPVSPEAPSVRRLLGRAGEEAARQLLTLQNNAAAMQTLQAVLDRGDCVRVGQLAVNGNDLAAKGLVGPQIGEALNALLDKVIEGELPNDRKMLLDFPSLP